MRIVEAHEEKHPERILGEYIAADSPGEWLAEEVGDYLFGGADDESREDGLEQVFLRVDDERRAFVSTQLDPRDLVQFTLEVEHSGQTMRATFGSIPSPVVLLDACIRIADVGDRVTVQHDYASGDRITFGGNWPFGMDWAVRATAPMGESLLDGTAEESLGLQTSDDLDFADLYDMAPSYGVTKAGVMAGFAAGVLTAVAATMALFKKR